MDNQANRGRITGLQANGRGANDCHQSQVTYIYLRHVSEISQNQISENIKYLLVILVRRLLSKQYNEIRRLSSLARSRTHSKHRGFQSHNSFLSLQLTRIRSQPPTWLRNLFSRHRSALPRCRPAVSTDAPRSCASSPGAFEFFTSFFAFF